LVDCNVVPESTKMLIQVHVVLVEITFTSRLINNRTLRWIIYRQVFTYFF